MTIKLLLLMLRCLIETLVIEVGIAVLLGYRKKDLVFITLVNILTNPIVVVTSNIFYLKYDMNAYETSLIFLELFALFTEAIIYKFALSDKKINPFTLSLILNASSFGIGEIINMILRVI